MEGTGRAKSGRPEGGPAGTSQWLRLQLRVRVSGRTGSMQTEKGGKTSAAPNKSSGLDRSPSLDDD